jgi:PAS domain S-box-containing protein
MNESKPEMTAKNPLSDKPPSERMLHQQIEWQRLVMNITQRVRRSLNLDEILNTTVTEVREFLRTDRVLIYRFDAAWHGQVVTESVGADWMPLLLREIHDDCFGNDYLSPFQQGQITAKSDLYTADMAGCHRDLLLGFQVRANLVVPILQGHHLWGLLIAHHCAAPRHWQPLEMDLLRQLATQVGLAIQQADLFAQVQVELQERRRTQDALRQSEERWQLAIAGSKDGIWDYDLRTPSIFLSDHCLEIMDHALADIDDFAKWPPLIHPDDFEAVMQAWESHLQGQSPAYNVEYRLRRADGRYRWIQVRGQALWNDQGQAVRVVGSMSDIGDRKQAEAEIRALNIDLEQRVSDRTAQLTQSNTELASEIQGRQQIEDSLREAERRWRSLLEHVRLVVVSLDRHGRVEFANPFFLALTGYPLSAVLGQNWFDCFLPASEKVAMQRIFRETLEQDAHPYHQHPILTKSGDTRMIAWNNTLLRTAQGDVIGTISIGEDITQRQAVERLKDEFISIVSHELRTPLTSIRGSLGLLATGVLNDAPRDMQRMIEIAALDTERLVRLVNDILDLERLASGKVALARTACSSLALMQRSLEVMQPSAQEAGIALAIAVCPDLSAWADSDRLIQTLTNLLSNAIKFSPAGSTVSLSAERIVPPPSSLANTEDNAPSRAARAVRTDTHTPMAEPHVRFQVQDSGRGIPADKLETVFGRFQQVDASDARLKGGTGLGLAICQSIVQQHGGHIWVESRLGQGSTFYFTMPLAPEST